MMASTAVEKKAARLLESGAVREARANVFLVTGDTATYYVTYLGPDNWSCECPSTLKACSHALAAAAYDAIHRAKAGPAIQAVEPGACGDHCRLFAEGFGDICPRCNGTGNTKEAA